jgi:hypothetical protein
MYRTQVAILLRIDAKSGDERDDAVAMAKIAGTYDAGYYPKLIYAYARDYFAVHHSAIHIGKWTLTHVPTGLSLVSQNFDTKREAAIALDYVVKKSAELGLEWTFTKPSDLKEHDRYDEFTAVALEARACGKK